MTRSKHTLTIGAIACIFGCNVASTMMPAASAQALSQAEAMKISTDAYIYGYPLVTFEMTQGVMSNTDVPKNFHAPMGQFFNAPAYPDAKFRDVTEPNADTLYSTAWVEVGKEPYVLSIPEIKNRFFLFPMYDGWTNVIASPGTRTTGSKAQLLAVTGPDWKGTLPSGVQQVKSPVNLVWILGRIYCSGTPEDYEAVHAIQAKISLVPLSAYGKPYTPPKGNVDPSINMTTAVRAQVDGMSGEAYFKLLTALMKGNPPSKDDAPMVAQLAKIGVVPGQDFDLTKLDPVLAKAIASAPKAGVEKIVAAVKTTGTSKNGWSFSLKGGSYGTDYLVRAVTTYTTFGANIPQDSVYPLSQADASGTPYSGADKYVMHFPKGQIPPVNGFWSLTMYDADFFFVANPLNKYNVSYPRDKLKFNADGSFDLYIQNESPGNDKVINWLPAPKGKFNLVMRLYYPRPTAPSILDGTWAPPAVEKAK